MSELRKDPIIHRWVIISTERGRRPDEFTPEPITRKSAGCPFCSGNETKTPPEITAVRPDGGPPDSPGWKVRVVPNKFPALTVEGNVDRLGVGMYDQITGVGAHEVIIETPDHNSELGELPLEHVQLIMETYKARLVDLENDTRLHYILIFKNEGEQAGASLNHPHSQLIATPITPKRVAEELQGSQDYYNVKVRCVYCDIIREELNQGERLIYENDHFVAFCPYASRFPFEVWVLPRRHQTDFKNLLPEEMPALAEAMKTVMTKLAVTLNHPQYNYVLHTGPNRYPRLGYWQTIDYDYHWHIEIIPRLVRIAGFEWGTGFYINPTLPEDAAGYLREAG